MADASFNPYKEWFGIPLDEQPPDHYRLLGLERYEDSQTKIEDAVAAQVEFLQALSMGAHVNDAQQILNEVAMARICLVNPDKKREYDQRLRNPANGSTPTEAIPVAKTVDPDLTSQQALEDLKLALELRKGKPVANPPRAIPISPTAKKPVEPASSRKPIASADAKNITLLPVLSVVAVCLVTAIVGIVLWNGKTKQPIANFEQAPPVKTRIEQNFDPKKTTPAKTNDKPKSIGDSNSDQPKNQGGDPNKNTKPVPNRSKDILFEDFETDYGKWEVMGTAFSNRPTVTVKVSGYLGDGLADSYHGGDRTRGTLLSEPFKIERRYIHFLCEGGDDPASLGVQLLVKDDTVREATGTRQSQVRPVTWDVKNFVGQAARLRILDAHGGRWGCIRVDHFVFSDRQEHFMSRENYIADAVAHTKPSAVVKSPIPATKVDNAEPADTAAKPANTTTPELTADSKSGDSDSSKTAKTEVTPSELVLLSEESKAKDSRKNGQAIIGKPFWTPGKGVQTPKVFKAVRGDLLESRLAEITRDNGAAFDRPDWYNGVTDVGNAYDVTGGHGENGVEIHFDTTDKPGGFDIAEIRVFTAGTDNPAGNAQVSQSFTIMYQLAENAGSHDDRTFKKLGDVLAEPDQASTNGGILMTGTFNDLGGPLLTGVSAIKLATKNVKAASGSNIAFVQQWIQEIDIIEYSGVLGQTATLAMPGFNDFKHHFELPARDNPAKTKIDDLKLAPSLPLKAKLHFQETWANPKSGFQIRRLADDEFRWTISADSSDNESPSDVASLWVDADAMYFQWLSAATQIETAEYLRNGIVEFSVSESHSHRLNLRSPVELAAVQLSDDDYSAKLRTQLNWLPRSKDLQIELLPLKMESMIAVCRPSIVTNKPAIMYFTKQPAKAFLWLELDGSAGHDKLALDAELKLNVPDHRNKIRPHRFGLKLLNNRIANLNQAIATSSQTVGTIKDPNQKKQLQAAVNQAKESLTEFKKYEAIATGLKDQGIGVEVFFEFEGHRVVVAKTVGRSNKVKQ